MAPRANLANRSLGRWGEDRAVAHFRSLGYELLDRNWRSPLRELPGELDVIACTGRPGEQVIVFCEVKTRRSARHGGGVMAVGAAKQQRVRALAEAWLRARASTDSALDAGVRFDVVAIDGVRLTHYESAF
jgi:putative endonuclease